MKSALKCSFAAALMLAGLALPARAQAPAKDIPKHRRAIFSSNRADLTQFDTFISGRDLNSDQNQLFKVEKGVIHVSGKKLGYLITRQEFKNYYLRAEFKWGEGTFGSHEGKVRDSGILYDIQGENRIWPRSIEFQIDEGCTGDFWITDGAALTGKDGARVTGPDRKAIKIDRFNKGPVQNVLGFRDPENELEKPHGEWNLLELVNR